jgi:hypothetical protein
VSAYGIKRIDQIKLCNNAVKRVLKNNIEVESAHGASRYDAEQWECQ